ncbi:MAG TPA: hypothetical protein VMV79_04960 [Alphaproteobacteria bacterium]|nr:hypothetical protein [Alphaproteobacteria bacterium]
MKRLLWIALLGTMIAPLAHAEGMKMFPPQDQVIFTLSAEDWVTTKTAHVTIAVDAAVKGSETADARADMLKAVNALAPADWRLTSFARSQDQSGLERWNAGFEARLPESDLGGLGDKTRKLSKPGMQLAIGTIDFTPTLAETEAARGALRDKIYKMAQDQLEQLNTALPGHNYHIALIDFTGGTSGGGEPPMPRVFHGPLMNGMAMAASEATATSTPEQPPIERAEQITMTARVVLAATAESSGGKPEPALAPKPAPMPPKKH